MTRKTEKLSPDWLFQRHPEPVVRRWVQGLRYFHFTRAWGGQANDGDSFEVRFPIRDWNDLRAKLADLKVPLSGRGLDDFEQPSWCIVTGRSVFVYVEGGSLLLAVSGAADGDRYEVSEEDFRACQEIERLLERLPWAQQQDGRCEANMCCISRERYPELFR
jgi:hypothetical protein